MIDARQFCKAYIKEVQEDKIIDPSGKRYIDIYRTDSKFTDLVNYTLIPNVIQSIDSELTVQHEYFRIDTVAWRGKYKQIENEAKSIGINPHLWDLKIAVEHENSKTDWLDEVIKLIHIRCPLKVVVCYNYCDCRGTEELNKLAFTAKCMNMIDALCQAKEEYLIIIGNGGPKHKENRQYEKFDYRGYLYNYENKCFDVVEK